MLGIRNCPRSLRPLLLTAATLVFASLAGSIHEAAAQAPTSLVPVSSYSGAPLRAAAPPPPTSVSASRLTAGESAGPQPVTPAPGPAGGGLPTGSYACSYNSPYVGEIQTARA